MFAYTLATGARDAAKDIVFGKNMDPEIYITDHKFSYEFHVEHRGPYRGLYGPVKALVGACKKQGVIK